MAALLETPETPAPAQLAGSVNAQAASEATRYSKTGEMIAAQMPDLVKGAGLRPKGGNMPLTNHTDIMTRSAQAAMDLRPRPRGFTAKSAVVEPWTRGCSQFGALKTALLMPSMAERSDRSCPVWAWPSLTWSAASLQATWVLAPSRRRPCTVRCVE